MRKFKTLATLAVLAVAVVGCNRGLRKEVKSFMQSSISIPKELIKIQNGHVSSDEEFVYDKATLVIYHGPYDCSSCAINHLYDDLTTFEHLYKEFDCKIEIIFAPDSEEIPDVVDGIRALDFPFPVFVDQFYEFERHNEGFPEDKRFHTFLMDTLGHPICIGNPMTSEKVMDVLQKALRGEK